jgi:hypothetical protein
MLICVGTKLSEELQNKLETLENSQLFKICLRIIEEEESVFNEYNLNVHNKKELINFIATTLNTNTRRDLDKEILLEHWFIKTGIEKE